MTENTIIIKKDILWKVATVLFAVLFIISLFTGGFGISGGAIVNPEENKGNGQSILECVGNYDLNENTIIFFYSDSCGWCSKMKPGVESLIERDYDIYLANANEGGPLISECVLEHITSGGVPQFICVKTGEIKVGAFVDEDSNLDQEALNTWVENCLA